MQTDIENSGLRVIKSAAMQESPRHNAWSDRDSNSSYRYIPAPPGIKHPFSQTRYNEGSRTTPSRSYQNQNHNQTWQQKADNYRHQSNPRHSHPRQDDDNSSQHSHSHRPRSNMRHPSAQRRPQHHNNPQESRAVSADRRRGYSDSPMRNDNYQRQSNGGGPRHNTPHRQNWRHEPNSHPPNHQHRPGPPGPPGPPINRTQSNPHATWTNYNAPRVSESITQPTPSPPNSIPPPATTPAADAASKEPEHPDDIKSNGPVKLPSSFEITEDLKKKYHMLESADGKIILLRKTPRGKRGGVKHRKNKLETVESMNSDQHTPNANETKSEDSDHSSSDVITVNGHGQRPPPPPLPRNNPNSPKRVQSIISQINRQVSSVSTSAAAPGSPHSATSSPRADPPTANGIHLPEASEEDLPTPTAEAADAADADAAAQLKKDALKRKRLEELMRELNDLRFAKQRAEEAQEQLSIQTQSLLQEKSSLLQRVGEREKQILNLQERLEYVEQECEDLRQVEGTLLDPQLLSVFSNGGLGELEQLMPGDGSLLDYGAGGRYSGTPDLYGESVAPDTPTAGPGS